MRTFQTYFAALKMVIALTLLVGVVYPLATVAVAHVPFLHHQAEGSRIAAGSSLIGQSFTDSQGNAVPQYFQSRPDGEDPTATGASNLGPENVVDTLPTPGDPGKTSLLTNVCTRSVKVGTLEHVSGARPFCTPDGVGAVLGVYYSGGNVGTVTRVVSLNQACPAAPFVATYQGAKVECAKPGEDYSAAVVTPIRGDAPAHPVVPADAVTGSGSGLDPDISPDYARLQAPRVAAARQVPVAEVLKLVHKHTSGRGLGFLGEPAVNVLQLNVDLDRTYPAKAN
ncbi:potassium-transporting ATPase subunit C [Catenulispora sp. NF23]|uniref:potassium-transporting ATPase subunit C n=1 Tax=Catenulispora pinistramenti TaxID=2705254 RepID=UPI001BAAF9EE|nr:potassium-transporting ATPase subunit C [Catenulispora pinistramenti]MBS2538933.1 potassium-transporting ATPase subunit C [Catenulispora pinistramenti]